MNTVVLSSVHLHNIWLPLHVASPETFGLHLVLNCDAHCLVLQVLFQPVIKS